MKPWHLIKSRNIGSFKIFDIEERVFENPRNKNSLPTYTIKSQDWVNVIGLTINNEVVLIRQFRFGSQKVELEIPGGLVESGEDPRDAASRELLEETGYEGVPPRLIGRVNPNPAIHEHTCWTYLIPSCKKKMEPVFDGPNESCEVSLIPAKNILDSVTNGLITHSLVIDAIFWYLLHENRIKM